MAIPINLENNGSEKWDAEDEEDDKYNKKDFVNTLVNLGLM